ncbi:kinase-like domain-containing protein [Xylogone sp. PMI_703]|nr:kinase-like domain-containing protein [Xylogone sp. PMI_703]
MSLVPYSSRDSHNDVVLRHDDAVVIRDPQTQQLVLRDASSNLSLPADCPTCHRPLRNSSPERQPSPQRHDSIPNAFISPTYFRMLQEAHDGGSGENPPSSPIRRLVEPIPSLSSGASSASSAGDAEFIASTPVPGISTHNIRKEAFSPNYFTRFFIVEKELGRGGKGVVMLVRHELDRVSLGQFACKRVPVGDDHAWLEKVLVEVQLLQGLSHPNLVSYRHVWLEDVQLNRFGPSVPCAYILQQYCNSGDLLHYIIGSGPVQPSAKEILKEKLRRRSRGQTERPVPIQRKLSFEEIYSFFKDITSGLAHLHESNYIHRDLKPSNCLLHRDGADLRCLISDFGEVQPENVMRSSTGATGTISYCAPEVLKMDASGRYGNFTTKSDIFSLGMILYFMCFGRLPYKSAGVIAEEFEDIDALRSEISSWAGFQYERRERPELPNQLYDFLKRLLSINPADRPSAPDILQALRGEKGFDKTPRASRNGSMSGGVSGRRIQSLDSPMPPSTPVKDPKRVSSAAYIEDAPSDSSPSPTASPNSPRTLDLEHTHSNGNTGHDDKLDTPLLMPPPTDWMSDIRHNLRVYNHYAISWAVLNWEILTLLIRLLIFFAKIVSITRPCSPGSPKEAIWYPLFGLATLELALGQKLHWKIVVFLAALHVVTLTTIMNVWDLCVPTPTRRWIHEDDMGYQTGIHY